MKTRSLVYGRGVNDSETFVENKRLVDGVYEFKIENLGKAHEWSQQEVENNLKMSIPKVIVSNTSTTEKELKPYLDLAEKYGYRVVSLIVEHRHSGQSIHNVPEETLVKQEQRLRDSLKLK